jgi:crotonobetainyl-CoA:carnitine CoA-transferase CaiB-like acyl-CoA transferase
MSSSITGETMSDAASPLRGIKVLDFTHGVAGPYAVTLLADLGAEVWKIEKPGRGDATRYMNVSRRFVADIPESGGDYFLAVNRNKQSVAVDLQHPEGRQVALRLVALADVVVSNFRPGVMERLGLGYEGCRAVRQDVIYAALSAYGERGPLAHQPGMDVAVQARSGVMHVTGNPGGGPVKPGASIADFNGGSHLAVAILAAMLRRVITGEGCVLHVSLLDAMMSILSNYSVAVVDGAADISPMGSGHPQLVPFQAFPSLDGHVVIASGTNRLYRDLCQVMGVPELAADARFATNVERVQHRDALVALLSEVTRRRTTAEWLQIFEENEIPSAPVNDLASAFAQEQLAAQDLIVEVAHPVYGGLHLVAAPYTFDGRRPRIDLPPPSIGQHTTAVLAAAGYDEEQLAGLRDRGTVGGPATEAQAQKPADHTRAREAGVGMNMSAP